MLVFLIAIAVSLGVSLFLVRRSKTEGHRFHDHDLSGPQKFHAAPVPRVGGIGIFIGALAGVLTLCWQLPEVGVQASMLLLCAVPAFGSGLTEDLTKTQSPRRRLFFTAMSAALGVWLMDGVIDRTAIPGLDWLVSFPIVARPARIKRAFTMILASGSCSSFIVPRASVLIALRSA